MDDSNVNEGDSWDNYPGLEFYGKWNYLPEPVLLKIFQYLSPRELLNAGLTCKSWLGVCYDNFLWRDIVYSQFQIDRSIKISPGKHFWWEEYKRLIYHIPLVETEVLTNYTGVILHVSFSHNGELFTICAEDASVIVWDAGYPAKIKYSESMRKHSWSLTNFSQFNQSDVFLLVSGINYIPEIAVFSLLDGFNLQYIIRNSCNDIIGTWFTDHYLICGYVHPARQLAAPLIELFLCKACQKTNSEKPKIFFTFTTIINKPRNNHSIMIANCPSSSNEPNSEQEVEIENVKELQPSSTDNLDNSRSVALNSSALDSSYSCTKKSCQDFSEINVKKLLIEMSSSKTLIPHELGFYKISPKIEHFKKLDSCSTKIFPENNAKPNHIIDFGGQIIGMALSPDYRFLYVNTRPWPQNYVINDPLIPPPIAREIDIHVIDLVTFKEVGTPLRGHKAYTPYNECFDLFLSVSNEYVASGAEDKHGYIWDRYYGICLAKYPHNDVVKFVAFNPRDSEMLVTASNDRSIKIWRSRHRVEELKMRSEHALPRAIEMRLGPKKKKRF